MSAFNHAILINMTGISQLQNAMQDLQNPKLW